MSGSAAASQVDFYVLDAPGRNETLRFACRIAEKAWQLGHRVYVHAGSESEARELDNLLWTFRQDSFVPHALVSDGATEREPVHIGAGDAPPESLDVMINLTDAVPAWADRCARVAEIVGADETAVAAGRDRYRGYKDRGFAIRSHRL